MPQTVNFTRLHEATLDDADFMGELVEMFLADAADQLVVLEDAIAREDQSAAGGTAHRLGGACRNLGAERLAALCEEIERRSEQGAAVEVSPVREEFGRVAMALQKCVSQEKSEAR